MEKTGAVFYWLRASPELHQARLRRLSTKLTLYVARRTRLCRFPVARPLRSHALVPVLEVG